MEVIIIIACYFAVMSIIGFASMGIDKWKAKHHAWRIPEHVLFAIAIFGGCLGSTVGMYFFHHKTKHWYFRYGFPLIFAIEMIVAAFIVGSGNITIM